MIVIQGRFFERSQARVRQKISTKDFSGKVLGCVGTIIDYHHLLSWMMTDYHHWCCDRDRIFRCLPIAPLQSSASACGSCGRRRRHSTELNLSGLVKGMRKCTVIYRKLSTSEAKVFNQDLSCFNPSSMILLGNLGEQTPLRDYLHKALSSFCMCTHPSNAFGLD